MHAVDTNVLVRLITRDNPLQTAAAEEFVAKGAWVSVLALAETVWVLSTVYELSPRDLIQVIEMLSNHEVLILEEPDMVAKALELFRLKPALGFSDCLMLGSARKAGNLPLGTFDRILGKMDGARKL